MHTTLNFTPANLQSPITNKPLIDRAGSISTALAATALRSYYAVTKHAGGEYPGGAKGRIVIARSEIAHLNNVEFEDPIPCGVMRASIRDLDREAWLQIFSDRSCLILLEDRDDQLSRYRGLMTVLPIVLKLPSSIEIAQADLTVNISVQSEGKTLDLRANYEYFGDKKDESLFNDDLYDPILNCVKAEIGRGIHAWAKEIPRLPMVIDPGSGPVSGVLGRTIPAPSSEAEGRFYVWPAAMPHSNFTAAQYEDAVTFLKLAYAYAWDNRPEEVSNAAINVIAADRGQSGSKSKIKVETIALDSKQKKNERLSLLIKKQFTKLIQHQAAPRFLNTMTSNTLIPTAPGSSRVKLQTHALYHGVYSRDEPSAHDRIKAISIFGQ